MNCRKIQRNSTQKFGALALLLFLTGLNVLNATTVYTFSVPVTSPWFDTGIDVVAGDQIQVAATGTVAFGLNANQQCGPNGGDPSVGALYDPLAMYPGTVVVSLIGKIGGTTAIGTGTLLPEGTVGNGAGFVGSSYNQLAPLSGRLFLGFNDHADAFSDNSGAFSVIVSVPEPSSAALGGLGLLVLYARKRAFRS